MSFLSFDDVHKSYGRTPALRGVSCEVRPGEVFGLLGPNGAGKTTLIRIALDIVRADRGSVALFGGPVDRDRLDRVTYLPEERGLYRRQTVRQVLGYFGALKGMRRRDAEARAQGWLERIGLPDVGSQRIDRLSKGMSQKVQIAATLLPEPELCILDEPFSGLDPVNGRLVKDLIAERREAGRATILSTHRMMEVQSLCDRVALVHRGRLVLYGAVAEVRAQHSHPVVRVGVEGTLPDVRGVASASPPEADGMYSLELADGAEPSDVLAALVGAGARVTHFERVLAPLEQVFVDVVRREEAAA